MRCLSSPARLPPATADGTPDRYRALGAAGWGGATSRAGYLPALRGHRTAQPDAPEPPPLKTPSAGRCRPRPADSAFPPESTAAFLNVAASFVGPPRRPLPQGGKSSTVGWYGPWEHGLPQRSGRSHRPRRGVLPPVGQGDRGPRPGSPTRTGVLRRKDTTGTDRLRGKAQFPPSRAGLPVGNQPRLRRPVKRRLPVQTPQ